MRIGIVTVWGERGAAYVSRAYLETLSVSNSVFIYARGGEIDYQGNNEWDKEYVTWGKKIRNGIPTFIVWKDFKHWVEENRLDTIIFNEQHSWEVILKTLSMGVKLGAYIDYYTKETIPFFWLYDFLLCNTRRHYSVFKDHPQCFYIPWGTNTRLFSGNCQPVSKGEVVFFHSAGMSPYRKGTDILIRAFQKVKGPARLVIHSQVPLRGHGFDNLLNHDDRISVIVITIGAPGLYSLGDIYVYPTRLEGIGLTIAEALSSGLPVITTNNPPMNEFVCEGINGKLVNVKEFIRREDGYYWDQAICDEEDLAKAMQYYVDHIKDLQEFKEKARSYATEKLDWSVNSRGLNKMIAEAAILEKPLDLVKAVKKYEQKNKIRHVFKAILRKLRGSG